jgi:hypothetical protein
VRAAAARRLPVSEIAWAVTDQSALVREVAARRMRDAAEVRP